MGNRKGILSY